MKTDKNKRLKLLKKRWDACSACSLHSHNTGSASNPSGKAHFRGNPYAAILLVGEALGRSESESGTVFFPLAPAGKKVEEILSHYELTDKVFIINPIACRSVDKNGRNVKPPSFALKACLPRFEELIEIVQPKIIVAMGAYAIEALTGYTGPVMKVMGEVFPNPYAPEGVMATCHPMLYNYKRNDEELKKKSKEVWKKISAIDEKYSV